MRSSFDNAIKIQLRKGVIMLISEVLVKILEILKEKDKILPANYQRVQELHDKGVKSLLAGNMDEAFTVFLESLKHSGSDQRLQGLCLLDLGNLARRRVAHTDISDYACLKVAVEIFDLARRRLYDELDLARAYAEQAMVHIAPTEMNRFDPAGLQKHIALLEHAIRLAKKVFYNSLSPLERRERAKQAWSFALHRLSGTVLGGTFARNFSLANREQQQQQCLGYIEELLTSGVPFAEEARLRANCAMYSFAHEPYKASETGKTFEECGKRIEPFSPVDAYVYYTYAAAAYAPLRHKCFQKAESLLPAYQKYIGNKVTEDLKLFLSLQEQLKK